MCSISVLDFLSANVFAERREIVDSSLDRNQRCKFRLFFAQLIGVISHCDNKRGQGQIRWPPARERRVDFHFSTLRLIKE